MAAVNHQEEPRTHTYTHAPGSEMRENQIIVIVSLGRNCFIKVLLSRDATTVKHGSRMTTECAIMRCNGE